MSDNLRNVLELATEKDEAGDGAPEARELLALPVVDLPASRWLVQPARPGCGGCGECSCGMAGKGEA